MRCLNRRQDYVASLRQGNLPGKGLVTEIENSFESRGPTGPCCSQLYVRSLTFAETSFNLSFRVVHSRESVRNKKLFGDFRA